MTTLPSKSYVWALDTNFDTSIGPSGSAWHNEPNKVLPIATRISQGYVPSQSLDAESLNYMLNSHADWIGWSSSSIADNSRSLNEVNRVLSTTGISSSASEWLYLTGAKTRTRLFAASELIPSSLSTVSGTNGWWLDFSSNHIMRSRADTAQLILGANMHFPSGSVITRIRAKVQPGAARAPGSRMEIDSYYFTPTMASSSHAFGSVTGPIMEAQDDGTTAIQTLDSTTIFYPIDKSSYCLFFTIRSGNTGGGSSTGDVCEAIEVTYTDLGPQNI